MSKKSVRRRITKEDARARPPNMRVGRQTNSSFAGLDSLLAPSRRRTRNGVTKTDSDLCRDQGRSVGGFPDPRCSILADGA